MKNQPILSRLCETVALLLFWPISIIASACYLAVSITLDIAIKVLGVWE